MGNESTKFFWQFYCLMMRTYFHNTHASFSLLFVRFLTTFPLRRFCVVKFMTLRYDSFFNGNTFNVKCKKEEKKKTRQKSFFRFLCRTIYSSVSIGKNIGLKAIRQIIYHFHKRSTVTSIVLKICAELWNSNGNRPPIRYPFQDATIKSS